jgi:uncharacterized protein (DUF2267 family)/ribosome-associated translation inhibitor RaiA
MTVDYEEFLTEVRRDAALPSDDAAVRAVRAALHTLGERLSGGEARDLARHLPEPLRSMLHDGEQPEPFGVEEYLHRVAWREGVEEAAAARHALAVFAALRRAAVGDEIRALEASLPGDLRALLDAAEAAARSAAGAAPDPAEAFVARVAERARLDPQAARRAAGAVLDALGERISSGQVDDLAAHLPAELAKALKRGNARSKGHAKALSLAEFARRVSDREGVPPEEARAHARAVLLTLRDTVGPEEFGDTMAQLPAEYRTLFDLAGAGAPARADRARRERSSPGGPPGSRPASGDTVAPETVEVHAPEDLPRETLAAARERLAGLQRHVGRPIISARLTLRHPDTRKARSRWVADASVDVDGRVLAAHATGRDALEATDAVVDRLHRRLRLAVGRDVALRNEPRAIAQAVAELAHEVVHRPQPEARPARARRVVRRVRAPAVATSVSNAVAELLDADQEFRLFRHDVSGEWLAVHRRDDGRIGVIHPPWMPLPETAGGLLVLESSGHAEPLTLDQAQAELAARGGRFLYFVDAADERPKVLYLRHDGDHGLVEPVLDG